jgi:omega-amidase
MRVKLVQNAPRLNRANLEEVLGTVQNGWGECDVIVFPELALNGYWLQDKVFEDAWHIDELSQLAESSANVDIVIGAAIKEDGRTYNSALYFSGGELQHLHHKVHLPNYGMFEEARYFFKGERIDCFESRYGKTALLVCEDLWRASVIAELAEAKPEIVYVLANSPARDFRSEGLLIEEQWDALLRSLALLSSAYVVFVNRVGFEDGLGFWGGSRVITAKGEIEHRLPNFDHSSTTVTLNQRLHDLQRWMAKLD